MEARLAVERAKVKTPSNSIQLNVNFDNRDRVVQVHPFYLWLAALMDTPKPPLIPGHNTCICFCPNVVWDVTQGLEYIDGVPTEGATYNLSPGSLTSKHNIYILPSFEHNETMANGYANAEILSQKQTEPGALAPEAGQFTTSLSWYDVCGYFAWTPDFDATLFFQTGIQCLGVARPELFQPDTFPSMPVWFESGVQGLVIKKVRDYNVSVTFMVPWKKGEPIFGDWRVLLALGWRKDPDYKPLFLECLTPVDMISHHPLCIILTWTSLTGSNVKDFFINTLRFAVAVAKEKIQKKIKDF